jgi:iron-sulfur cluster assembly protein
MSAKPKTAMEKAVEKSPEAPALAFRLTTSAAARLKALAEEQSIPADERNLRIGLKVGGCSGFSYELGFDKAEPTDLSFESEGIRVVVAREHAPKLQGMVVDFVDTVQEQGFKISNPNAKSTCGCGQSFEA